MPAQDSAGRTALRGMLGEFLRFARGKVAGALALMTGVAVLEGTGVLLLAPLLVLVGVVSAPGSAGAGPVAGILRGLGYQPGLVQVLCAYLVLIALHALVSWRRDMLASRLQHGFVDHLRQQLFDGVGGAEWAFIARTHSAEFSHALTTDLVRVNQGVYSLLELAVSGVLALAYAAVALHLSAPLTLAALGCGGLLLLSLRRRHRRSHLLGKNLTENSQRLHAIVSEYLAGLKLTKSANAEARLSQSFSAALTQARQHVLDFVGQQAGARSLLRLGGAAMLALLVYGAVRLVQVPPASVLVLVFIFTRLIPLLSQLQQSYERLLHSLPAYAAFVAMRERCAAAVEPAGLEQPYTLERGIRLDRLGYRPAGNTEALLREVSLEIAPRTTTALVGPSGAGKSTLADLVAGLLVPGEGGISIDGRALDDRRAWRRSVAYVPQETFLFNASIRENLQWTAPDADDEAIWAALDQAAAGFVRSLPQGLDTPVGERGIRLSGGERQRLAIARALLRKPLLLILDEATSNMDRDNEQRIQDTLARLHGHLTLVFIAHRLATVRDADRIVVIDGGRITEMGSYRELSNSPQGYLQRAAAEG